uniref:Ras GTPase-activating protein 1 n=1 Tax=Strigamia maritima TaxID=126957 RepID=T1JFR2_STRMM
MVDMFGQWREPCQEAQIQDELDDQDGLLDENVALDAPPENHWYHGRLDRYTCEQRLRLAGKCGSYLIRESDRRPGSYVLSYSGSAGLNHFRITAVCGDFYIGGRQFHSLADLIGYYTSWADLLKQERLQHPVPPPEPVNHERKVVATLPYTKMPDTDELSFQKGDIFIVHNDVGDGWLWTTLHRTGESGLIFQDLVERVEENVDPNQALPWFHGTVTKAEAVDALVKGGPGSFLVRPSDNSPGDYSLFFHIHNTIQRFRIENKGNRFLMGGRCFETLESIIDRYKMEQIFEGSVLGQPVNKEGGSNGCSRKSSRKSDDIYATLRESRETGLLSKKHKGIRMKGYLNGRQSERKKWKNLYFILQVTGTDQHLLFYDNPKRTKPKGLIDLSYTSMYMVDDSFFDRPNCFQLVERALPCLSTVHYLCAAKPDLAQEWMRSLRPLCVHQTPNKNPRAQRLKELYSLHVTILEAHRIPTKLCPHPYCILSLDQVKICRTQVREGPEPVWEEEFVLDDIPPDVVAFTVTVYNKGKRCKDLEVAEMSVELNRLVNGEEIEEWYELSGISPPIREDWGSMRIRVRYLHEMIMPLEEYNSLKELLLDRRMDALCALADVCHHDRTPLATTLLRVFRHEAREADLLQAMNDAEIKKEDETSTLFRAASLTTTLMDQYMRSTATVLLQKALQETIFKVLDSKQSCELNPSRLEHPSDSVLNAEHLLNILEEMIESIFMSVESCPRTLRYLFGCLQRSVGAKWPRDSLVVTRVVSGFIFLRLFCPAILNPRQFNLITEIPTEMAARSLLHIAKCLQNLANLVEFGGKEPYMEVVNPFITKHRERMILFLDVLSNVYEKPEPEETSCSSVPIDLARDLATVHYICVVHLQDLQNMARLRPNIKKLVTVTEMLSRHKEKYMEMLR